MKTKGAAKPRLTKAQRNALFAVGAFGTWKQYGSWGRQAQFRVMDVLRGYPWRKGALAAALVDDSSASCYAPALTEAGKARFTEEFGDPCPTHGWRTIEHSLRFCWCECQACVLAMARVRGWTPKCYDSCPKCKGTGTQAVEAAPAGRT